MKTLRLTKAYISNSKWKLFGVVFIGKCVLKRSFVYSDSSKSLFVQLEKFLSEIPHHFQLSRERHFYYAPISLWICVQQTKRAHMKKSSWNKIECLQTCFVLTCSNTIFRYANFPLMFLYWSRHEHENIRQWTAQRKTFAASHNTEKTRRKKGNK